MEEGNSFRTSGSLPTSKGEAGWGSRLSARRWNAISMAGGERSPPSTSKAGSAQIDRSLLLPSPMPRRSKEAGEVLAPHLSGQVVVIGACIVVAGAIALIALRISGAALAG